VRPGLVAHVDGRRQFHRIVGQWVLGVLQVGDHVVRGSAREAFDVRILLTIDLLNSVSGMSISERLQPQPYTCKWLVAFIASPLTAGLLGQE